MILDFKFGELYIKLHIYAHKMHLYYLFASTYFLLSLNSADSFQEEHVKKNQLQSVLKPTYFFKTHLPPPKCPQNVIVFCKMSIIISIIGGDIF